jgi:hypothetical protein
MSLVAKLAVNFKEGYLLNRLRQALDSLEPNLGSNYFDLELFKENEDGKFVLLLKKIDDKNLIEDLEKKKKKRKQKKKKCKKVVKSILNEMKQVKEENIEELRREKDDKIQEEIHDDELESSNEEYDNETSSLSIIDTFKLNVQNRYEKLIDNFRNEYLNELEQQGVCLNEKVNELLDLKSFLKAFKNILSELSFISPKIIFSKSIESFILFRENDLNANDNLFSLADHLKPTYELINLHGLCESLNLNNLYLSTSNSRLKSFYEYIKLAKELKNKYESTNEKQQKLSWKLFRKSFIIKPIDNLLVSINHKNDLLNELCDSNLITIVIYVPSSVNIDYSTYFNETFTNNQVKEAFRVLEDVKLKYRQNELDKNECLEYIRNQFKINNTLTKEIEARFINFI